MRSNLEWQTWGKVDPLYGVSSWEGKSKRGAAPWTDEEFYDHGKRSWEELEPFWRRYGLSTGSCLEIGCGAGRITKQLSQAFAKVYAVDVSPEMIEYARRHVGAAEFYLTDGHAIPLTDNSVSAAFSTDVFQHFPTMKDAAQNFRELFRVLATGGTIMIHLPIHDWPASPPLFELVYTAYRKYIGAKDAVQRMAIRFGRQRPFMTSIGYSAAWVYRTLGEIGFQRIEIVTFGAAGAQHRKYRSYIFATKH
jgi:ubiquinone/menaquinone biosynthesis C-methylase UbiE